MEADLTPSSQAASQISQRAAALTSWSPKTAEWTSLSSSCSRKRWASLTLTPPLASCRQLRASASRSETEVYCTVRPLLSLRALWWLQYSIARRPGPLPAPKGARLARRDTRWPGVQQTSPVVIRCSGPETRVPYRIGNPAGVRERGATPWNSGEICLVQILSQPVEKLWRPVQIVGFGPQRAAEPLSRYDPLARVGLPSRTTPNRPARVKIDPPSQNKS